MVERVETKGGSCLEWSLLLLLWGLEWSPGPTIEQYLVGLQPAEDNTLSLLKQYVEDTLTCKAYTLWGSMKCAIKPYIKKKVEVLEEEIQLVNPLKRKVEEMGLKLDSLKEKLSKYEDTVSKMNEEIMSQEAEIAKLQYDISDIDQVSLSYCSLESWCASTS
ncbi:uncharacterized protein LOC127748849 isoform X2 [Frankliniella occidentalis]|uniref:Uncharacterized protein LOC127748849 isoform X2 n=1 Tax=Frankliniella occidentalis TaxID=133901 RepID=A0A9C6WXJ0_FRAOC|nr:uncharacterized protein LOC127748849 isoform X2 [Frankliniella occidentalis]